MKNVGESVNVKKMSTIWWAQKERERKKNINNLLKHNIKFIKFSFFFLRIKFTIYFVYG